MKQTEIIKNGAHYWCGTVEFIEILTSCNSLISYEGETAKQIDSAFKEAIDDYLVSCKERGVEPEKPFKGSLNVRIGSERHEKAAIVAKELGCSSLNDFFKLALDHEFERILKSA